MLVVLLIISFLILAMPPLVHKKVAKRMSPNSHGRYECWISPDDGQVYEYYATSTEGTVSGYEGTATSFKGEDGEDTIIAYNCETGTCVNTIKAEGGKGGTSHILDKIEFRELTNEEIKNYSTGAATINLEDTLSTQSLSSQSEFSSLGFLSSISNISNDTGELLSEILGKSGDGGYVTHHCWLQPQYFVYSADHVEIPNYPTSDYEGYTNFSEGVITGLPQCTAKPGGLENQFDEEPGKPGKSGAIVIMW